MDTLRLADIDNSLCLFAQAEEIAESVRPLKEQLAGMILDQAGDGPLTAAATHAAGPDFHPRFPEEGEVVARIDAYIRRQLTEDPPNAFWIELESGSGTPRIFGLYDAKKDFGEGADVPWEYLGLMPSQPLGASIVLDANVIDHHILAELQIELELKRYREAQKECVEIENDLRLYDVGTPRIPHVKRWNIELNLQSMREFMQRAETRMAILITALRQRSLGEANN